MPPLYIPDSHLRLVEEADGTIAISLTGHLLAQLGRPTWIEYAAAPGASLPPGVPFCSIETEKTAYEVALPFEASFVAENPDARANPAIVRGLAGTVGWVAKIRPASDAWRDGLLDEAAYAAYVAP